MAHAAGDAHEYPIYSGHFRVTFPILDADGDLVTGATGLDSEVSIDSGTFADCTNEATEVATSSGMYYLDLTGAEMTGKAITVIVKTSSSGAKTTPITLYPRRLPVLETDTAEAGAGSTITLAAATASGKNSFYNGCFVRITNNSPAGAQYQVRRILSYVGSTRVATVDSAWGTNPSSASTYDILMPEAAGVIGWAGVRPVDPATAGTPDVNAKLWNSLTTVALPLVPTTAGRTLDVSAGGEAGIDWANVGSPTTTVGLSGTTIKTATDVETDTADIQTRIPAALVSGRMDASVGAMAANVITAAATAADFGAEVADAVWDEAISGHLSAGTTGLALNSAGSAGDPWSTAVPGAYGAGTAGKILGDNLNATVSSRAVAGDAMALTSSERTTLAAAIWNALTSGMSTVGSVGKKLADWVVGTIDTYTGNTKQTGDSYSVVTHVTYGNSALHDDITNLQTYIDTEIAAILEDTGTTLPAQIAALNNLSASQVNAEVVDVLATDTAAELAAVPAANASLKAKITFLAMLARNKLTQTSTQSKLYADDGTTQVGAATVSDDGTTYTRGELA